MADKFNLGDEVRELKIGPSFTNSKAVAFHTIRYDFKPASVDISKSATIDVADTNQVTLTVPHLDGAGVHHTVFKGSQKPYQKECVLIIDKITGEVTLEKLTGNILVKKTRNESAKINHNQQDNRNSSSTSAIASSNNPPSSSLPNANSSTPTINNSSSNPRSQTPPICQRQSNKTKVTSGSRRTGADRHMIHMVPRHSPLHASPNPGYAQGLQVQNNCAGGNSTSPGGRRSPGRGNKGGDRDTDMHNSSSMASLPMIGMDDFSSASAPVKRESNTPPRLPNTTSSSSNNVSARAAPPSTVNATAPSLGLLNDLSAIGEISDSSSSSSSSDSEEDEDSDKEEPPTNKRPAHSVAGNSAPAHLAPPASSNSWNHSSSNNSSGQQPTASQHSNGVPNHAKTTTTVPNAHILNQDLDLSESGSESD